MKIGKFITWTPDLLSATPRQTHLPLEQISTAFRIWFLGQDMNLQGLKMAHDHTNLVLETVKDA